MGRAVRDQAAGYHHVTLRGNDGAGIYAAVGDRTRFLDLLGWISFDHEWDVPAWCLLTNHFHLVLDVPAGSLSEGMHRLASRYAHWFNARHLRTGHLFERRFSSKRVEGDEQMENTVQYILDNPVKAGLCRDPREWPWLGGELLRSALARRR
jgi:putative transposase